MQHKKNAKRHLFKCTSFFFLLLLLLLFFFVEEDLVSCLLKPSQQHLGVTFVTGLDSKNFLFVF